MAFPYARRSGDLFLDEPIRLTTASPSGDAFSAAPMDLVLSASSLFETAVENLPVATIRSGASSGSTITYSYLGDSLGGAFRIEGDRLIVGDSGRLDAESHSTVSVWIRATDEDGRSSDETLVLEVGDSNREARYSAGPEAAAPDATAETAHLPGGGFVHIRHNAASSDDLLIDMYDAAGQIVRTVNVPHSGQEWDPSVAGLPSGGFVVTWASSAADGDGLGVRAQLFDSAGNALGGTVNVNSATANTQDDTAVAGLSGGGFVVAWSDSSEPSVVEEEIKAQMFDHAGNKLGGEFMVNLDDNGRQGDPDVAGLSNGGFVITWTDSAAGNDIRAQVYDAAGTPVGGTVTVNTTVAGWQFDARVTALGGGGFVVTWYDHEATVGDTDGHAVRAQIFDNAGNRVGDEILVNTRTAGHQAWSNIDSTPDGGFVVAWQDVVPSPTDSEGLTKVQFFDSAGNRSGPEFAANTEATSAAPAVVALGNGDLFLGWRDGEGGKTRLLTLEHPVVANEDAGHVAEDGFVEGNVLANDYAQPGAPLRVGAVGGQAANVGETIVLASGATVQVDAGGHYRYNANGAFAHLVGAAGAANHGATDSFAYTLSNGTSATATIHVTGIGADGDRPVGTLADDVIVGTDSAELFDLDQRDHNSVQAGNRPDQGGRDTVRGNGGNDAFYFGGTLNSFDVVTGGPGLDTLILQGDYAGGVKIASNITGIEALSFLAGNNGSFGDPGTNLYSYKVFTANVTFAAGLQVKVNASALLAGENFTFNGASETDARFLVYGGRGTDALTGGMGNDIFFFGDDGRLAQGDTINGGPGYDGLFLRGNYVIDFSAGDYSSLLTAIENITLTSIADERYARGGGTEFDYNIKFGDAQVAAGEVLTVSGALLRANETLVVDGTLESNGAFRIFGGASDDTLMGGAGADFIEGGLGGDTIRGGSGNDLFSYKSMAESSLAASDQILDFAGGDKIDLRTIDANLATAANDAFAWIGDSAFSGEAGQLRGSAIGSFGNWIAWRVEGDADGDGAADLQIFVTITDGHPIAAEDFFL